MIRVAWIDAPSNTQPSLEAENSRSGEQNRLTTATKPI